MKKLSSLIICMSMTLLLCACAKKTPEIAESTLTIQKDGTIAQTIVESFDKDYYSVDELREEYDTALAEYSAKGNKSGATLTDIHTEDGKIFVSLEYESAKADEEFSGAETFFGTVNDAYDAGYTLEVTLKSVSDGDKIGKSELMDMKKAHILIMSESGIVKTYSKIQYVSANAEVLSDKSVRISSDSDGLAYIVMK